jgi:hypothetical protein
MAALEQAVYHAATATKKRRPAIFSGSFDL